MQETKADFTMTFRQLGDLPLFEGNDSLIIHDSLWALQQLKTHPRFYTWLNLYRQRLLKHGVDDNDESRKRRTRGASV